MPSRLDFLVIGAQKCATTWLHDCLAEHPRLALPKRKLEMEYLGGDLFQERSPDWYFGLFPEVPTARARGHVSVEYLADPRSPAVVHAHLPDVKLIVSLRDPVDRAISALNWYARKRRIDPIDVPTGLRRALAALESDDPRDGALRDVLTRGFYAEQLERYLTHFSLDRFLFLDYDDIAHEPEAVLHRVFTFLEVDGDFRPPSIGTRPKHDSGVPLLNRVQRVAPNSRIAGKVLDLLHQKLHRMGVGTSRRVLDAGLRTELRATFGPQNARLRDLLAAAARQHRSPSLLAKTGWLRRSTDPD